MMPLNRGEAFLDTTFLLPFFQIPLSIERFTVDQFEAYITKLTKIHTSELSVFETKAKISKLAAKDNTYNETLKNFAENLRILRSDEKILFHPYTSQADKHFEDLKPIAPQLDIFDLIILAQAVDTGTLLTEDKDLIQLRKKPAFNAHPLSKRVTIKRWKEVA